MKKIVISFLFIPIIYPVLGSQMNQNSHPSLDNSSSMVTLSSQHSEEFNQDTFWDVVEKNFVEIDISDVQDKELVILLGDTGNGKSTVTNILLGHEMEEKKIGYRKKICVKEPRNKKLPFAVIGHKKKSETVIPCIYTCEKEGLSYMDCPGFWDTNGIEQEAFNSIIVRFFVEACKSVKCVAVVIPEANFYASRGQEMIKKLLYLSRTFNLLGTNFGNILWLVTKCDNEVSTEVLGNEIKEIWEARREGIEKKQNTKREDQVAVDLLSAMFVYKENILPVHPLDKGESRMAILKRLKGIEASIPKERFKIIVTQPIDIQGVVRNMFLTQGSLTAYRESLLLLTEVMKNRKDKETLARILSNPNQESNRLLLCSKVIEDRIKKNEQKEEEIQKEIDKIEARKNEIVEYKTISKKLGAYFFGDEVNIVYNDLPFEYFKEAYQKVGLKRKKRKDDRFNGKFHYTYMLPANKANIASVVGVGVLGAALCAGSAVVGAGIGAVAVAESLVGAEVLFFAGAGGAVGAAGYGGGHAKELMTQKQFKDEAEVVVKFYVRREHLGKKELTYQKRILKTIRNQLKEDIYELSNLKRGIKTDSSTQSNLKNGLVILQESIDKLQKRIDKDEEKLKCCNEVIVRHKRRLEFIYYTYRLFYQNQKSINPLLESFEKQYRMKEGKKAHKITPTLDKEEQKEDEEEEEEQEQEEGQEKEQEEKKNDED